MAIVFDCPHCKTNYRLKDEYAGKTATCKNPKCRKVIPIPQPNIKVLTGKAMDIDAIAAAAFSDEPAAANGQVAEATIQVTCSGCDHVWMVEASKEGKNVLCPECRRPNRVPLRKKEEKADWRTGGSGRPSGAKVETGLDREGAFATTNVGSIGQQTAREIVRDRESQEEPEVRRKRLIKRGIFGVCLLTALGIGGCFVFKKRGEIKDESTMEQAVADLKAATPDPRFQALILRASGEYRLRTAKSEDEAKAGLMDLQTARNTALKIPPSKSTESDRNGALGEIAVTMVEMLGTAEQVESGERFKEDVVVKEIRQTLQGVGDSELVADAIRAITRRCAEKEQPGVPGKITRGLNSNELLGQVGLELLRLDRQKYQAEVEKLLATALPSSKDEATSIKTLRLILAKPAAKKGGDGPMQSWIASAESAAFKGDSITGLPRNVGGAKPEDRIRALAAAAHVIIDARPAEAATLLEAAMKDVKETKAIVSPWVGIRVCRLLAKAGRPELAELAAKELSDDAKGWAHLEILRGKLAAAKDAKVEDSWSDPLSDPTKSAAAVKAREEMARHNSLHGHDYQGVIKSWDKAVQPFGTAGTILGREDRKSGN
jgi:hypothetical protein